MKKYTINKILFFLSFVSLFGIEKNSKAQIITTNNDSNFYAVCTKFLNLNIPPSNVESGDYNQFKVFNDFWGSRLFPHGSFNVAARAFCPCWSS